MLYKIIPGTIVEPITLDEARFQLRADQDTGIDGAGARYDDPDIVLAMAGARAWVEQLCSQIFHEFTAEIARDEFPCCPLTLPGFPVKSITSVKYLDTAGVEQTLNPSLYLLDDYQNPSSIVNAYNTTWPATLPVANAVKVRYVLGGLPIPANIKKAILGMTAHLYHNAGDDYNDQNYLGPPHVRALCQFDRESMGI